MTSASFWRRCGLCCLTADSDYCLSTGKRWVGVGNLGISVFCDSGFLLALADLNLLCRPCWLWTHRASWLCLPMLGFTACTITPSRSRSLRDACQMGTIPSCKSAFITSNWVCRLHSLKVLNLWAPFELDLGSQEGLHSPYLVSVLLLEPNYVLLVTALPAAQVLFYITRVWDMRGSGYKAIKSRKCPSLGNKGPHDLPCFG